MDRTQKKLAVEEVSSILGDIETVIVSHNKGLTVAQITELRNGIRDLNAEFKILLCNIYHSPFIIHHYLPRQ